MDQATQVRLVPLLIPSIPGKFMQIIFSHASVSFLETNLAPQLHIENRDNWL